MEKGILLLIIVIGCIFLVLDSFYGNQYIDRFVVKSVPQLKFPWGG